MARKSERSTTQSVARYYDEYGWSRRSSVSGEDARFRRFSPAFQEYSKASTARVLAGLGDRRGGILFVGGGDMPESHQVLCERFAQVTCLDVSKVGLELAQEKLGSNAAYVAQSIVDCTLPGESFDVIYCAHVLYHIDRDEQEAAVRQMIRLARPGGRIIIVYANRLSPFRLPGRIWQGLQRVVDAIRNRKVTASLYYYEHGLGWWRRFRPDCEVHIEPWEVVADRFAGLLRPAALERRFFDIARRMETHAPAVAARLWHFPMVVLDKRPA